MAVLQRGRQPGGGIGRKYDAHVFLLMNFLTDEQDEELAAVGEFFDKERVLTEVLEPLRGGEDVLLCRRFNCATQGFRRLSRWGGSGFIIEGV